MLIEQFIYTKSLKLTAHIMEIKPPKNGENLLSLLS